MNSRNASDTNSERDDKIVILVNPDRITRVGPSFSGLYLDNFMSEHIEIGEGEEPK